MGRYFIEEVKCGVTEGGMACGPVFGNAVASVKYTEDGKNGWLSIVEVDGIPNVFQTDVDVFDKLLKEDPDDEEFWAFMQAHSISMFDSIEFGLGYGDTFESVSDGTDDPAWPLVRYLIALVRCAREDEGGLISMAQNRYADELDIPVSDVEEEWMEGNE